MNKDSIIKKVNINDVNINDPFFDSLRSDYKDFNNWFNKKKEENKEVYITTKDKSITSFLMLKIEEEKEIYNFSKEMPPKKRIKICTFKVIETKENIGTSFLNIILKEANINNIKEIYTTIYKKYTPLIKLFEKYGFKYYCDKITLDGNNKENIEQVYVLNKEEKHE